MTTSRTMSRGRRSTTGRRRYTCGHIITGLGAGTGIGERASASVRGLALRFGGVSAAHVRPRIDLGFAGSFVGAGLADRSIVLLINLIGSGFIHLVLVGVLELRKTRRRDGHGNQQRQSGNQTSHGLPPAAVTACC